MIIIATVYVDDIIITGNDVQEFNFLKAFLDKVFTIKDLGALHSFLGIEVSYQEDGIVLTQQKFTRDLLLASSVKEFKKVVTPLPLITKLSSSDRVIFEDPILYRSLVGKLNFLSNTRPELRYII